MSSRSYRLGISQQVVYWEDDTKPETMGKIRVPGNQTSVAVSGLVGSTQYFLTVSAFNTAGTGPFLSAINATTKKPSEYACSPPPRPRRREIVVVIAISVRRRCCTHTQWVIVPKFERCKGYPTRRSMRAFYFYPSTATLEKVNVL